MFSTLVGMYYVVAYLEYDRDAPGPSSGFECQAWAKPSTLKILSQIHLGTNQFFKNYHTTQLSGYI